MSEPIDIRTLRIGNILEYKGKLVYVTTLSMDIDDEYQETIGFCEVGKHANEKSDWNRALAVDLKPVELSVDWLHRCGFSKYHENPRLEGFYVNGQGYYPFKVETTRNLNIVFQENTFLQYLHLLQNLFSAINGEDLKIDLEEM